MFILMRMLDWIMPFSEKVSEPSIVDCVCIFNSFFSAVMYSSYFPVIYGVLARAFILASDDLLNPPFQFKRTKR